MATALLPLLPPPLPPPPLQQRLQLQPLQQQLAAPLRLAAPASHLTCQLQSLLALESARPSLRSRRRQQRRLRLWLWRCSCLGSLQGAQEQQLLQLQVQAQEQDWEQALPSGTRSLMAWRRRRHKRQGP